MSEIKPAFDTEQWSEFFAWDHPHKDYADDWASPHQLAALCLYGEPFGFTQADVDMLRELATSRELHWTDGEGEPTPNPDLTSLADRIASLLPPREQK